ncbi:phosphoenolpyruvate--protein phosphotransferase [Microbacterium hydrocarbonoxydans]|uniref:phosphoenolpyruvate--protein phosphotransferase n=1 Tax=Microbacterium hydrocarbonoxydans TaxID=273678 RepID=UPI00203B8F38|nr:phosphoenolpyruvate--protein phosphotransferase [Microbacterium hydrocarbonoxydans]MCM3779510.1 phosphoenolpyruvate--protein phosphotransferase [Microbacterium hydrocarbonoxydans]
MIGVVAVSHSARLGEAALELALQMVPSGRAQVRVAAGAGTDADGAPVLGTDAVAVASAIDELAADCDGVLVVMDLGSAVLSAELALELRASDVPVRLAPAPFVEGLLAAVVSASAGGALDAVAAEASGALAAKADQLGEEHAAVAAETPGAGSDGASAVDSSGSALTRTVRVRNALGIHARPAALIAEASAGAVVRLRRLPDGPEASAASLSRLLVLDARHGDEVELTAEGPEAEAALDRVSGLFEDGFGEGTTSASAEPPASTRSDSPESATSSSASSSSATSSSASVTSAPAPGSAPVARGTVLRGRGVSPGLVSAPVVLLGSPLVEPDPAVTVAPADRAAEVSAIEWAAVAVADQLRRRTEKASSESRAILDTSRLLASDPELVAEATALVQAKGRTAARAVWEVGGAHARTLAALGGRMAERVADVLDVRDRIIAEILEVDLPGVPERDEPFVLVARDLAPADTAALEGGNCIALVTEEGGPTSHTAIIARSLGLPAVVAAAGATGIAADSVVLVDGERGTVEVEPSAEAIEVARAASEIVPFDGRGALADGESVALLANAGGVADANTAVEAHAEGIGLFRTEFSFLGRADAPSVEEQIAAYRAVIAPFAGRRVVVRTLDAGSDKPLPFTDPQPEENPALGVRGLRLARRSPQLLDDQLRALAVAAEREAAHVEVMAPMVATVDEARLFSDRCREAGLERVGVMIETPAAALLAAELFDVVDFVSIGTNDLTQYTMAADRLLGELGDLNDPWQPAVLRLIHAVGDAGRAAGKPVGVCGEAAGDPALAPVLIGLGVTSLSMTPRALGRVAASLRTVTRAGCRRAGDAARGASTAEGARADAARVLGG